MEYIIPTFVLNLRCRLVGPPAIVIVLFMCSFDISSLFTNVPLEETFNICADALYCDDSDAQPLISKAVFIELMKSATSGVEFSFNDIM